MKPFILTALLTLPAAISRAQTNDVIRLPAVVVTGRADSLLEVAPSATVGTVGAAQLQHRPLLRPGEVLETVPGVIITQHSGGGKANQFFLRGFNLDHGTDLATTVADMPVNLPSHGHGQGYTDLNFMIPELIETVDYRKGPYFADQGDFASAGAAKIRYFNVLPATILQLEGGSYGYGRFLFASSPAVGARHLLYAFEASQSDGPWDHPDDLQRFNGVARYSRGDTDTGYSFTAMAYHGKWDATDQIAHRAPIGRFDSLNPTDGGHSQRYSLSGEWHGTDGPATTRFSAYAFYYDLDLYSDFTYFLDDPVNGDQFLQHDQRWVGGFDAAREWPVTLFGHAHELTLGAQFRTDAIENGLDRTVARRRLSTTRADDILQTSGGLYWQDRTQWLEKFRTVAGVRGDAFRFDVDSDHPANAGERSDFMASPKLSLIFGPWTRTEYYVSGGMGYHSNDGRGVNTTIDPGSGAPFPAPTRSCVPRARRSACAR